MSEKKVPGEFWRVIRFLDEHNVGFIRSDTRYPYDSKPIYVDGHSMRHLADAYNSRNP